MEARGKWDSVVPNTAYRTRSSIDFTVLSRAPRVLLCCGGKTSDRIRQEMEIWSLDTPRVITTSATTPG
ncbi:unnamed protein product [Adineta ricciae]|uniref:Uncharacterized protein n=1 Tax=Adineta ricciae TaxID=249248 RepID=A0A814SIZ6_ADIRI|nr:unnamed protein product [Adineta ricciae]